MMDEENLLDFNFWPSFTDLMLAVVLVLFVVLFLFAAVLQIGTVNLSHVNDNQKDMVKTIASFYGDHSENLEVNVIGIYTRQQNTFDLFIRNEPTVQRIIFSDQILFNQDDYRLNKKGREFLIVIGEALKRQLSSIKEIQIQGHADADQTSRYPSNMHLAAMRAIEVLDFLKDEVGIDPAEHLMSATSFGEFKPVDRSENDRQYNREKLLKHNSTVELKNRNRRIELLLFYRL